MFNHQYVDIRQIVDKTKRGRLYKELPYESAIDYAVEAYRLIAQEKAEITKPARIEIENYRGLLPKDLERILQTVKVSNCNNYVYPMRYGTNNFHSIFHCLNSPDTTCESEYTYTLNNNYIQTNFEEGYVFMAYKALPSTEECELMIPDEVNFKLAVEYYMKSRFLDDLGSDDPKINNQQQKDDQQYCWYVGKAQAAMTAMSMDEYRSFANSVSQLFDTDDHYLTFLDKLGTKEYIRRHG